ncbi:GPO family capsid scaffolding protein [Xanthomonas citri]|uniref:GPO family capsid scaffolding protein n=1 Tax=Xanthomonas citri TaxID=346 RepID=UPI0009C1C8DC|nr:GPO family capsid scaffolding protein [Xanthomonas citri]AMV03967.1 phage capsid scaffolding protein [Xanthomonas citri pv. aurantifolii]TBX00966.1 phage capsid scaffolding protein [Xanthomonas citri pv. aurantifolii]
MKKKFKSNWFRVAVEGATTDGRVIERQQIEDMAATYDPNTYGARVWIEHLRSMLPDSPFRAYGDVTAVKAEDVTIAGSKKLALFAQITPTNDLVKIVNDLKQKIFTSIEITPKFADSGRAYLTGLGVTDSPASLGTSMLAFAAQNPDENPLAERKQHKDNLFTVATETELQFTEEDDAAATTLLARIKKLLGTEPAPKPAPTEPSDFTQIGEIVTQLAQGQCDQGAQFTALQEAQAIADAALTKLTEEFSALRTQLSQQPDPRQTQRPPVTGSDATVLTDC